MPNKPTVGPVAGGRPHSYRGVVPSMVPPWHRAVKKIFRRPKVNLSAWGNVSHENSQIHGLCLRTTPLITMSSLALRTRRPNYDLPIITTGGLRHFPQIRENLLAKKQRGTKRSPEGCRTTRLTPSCGPPITQPSGVRTDWGLLYQICHVHL